MLRSRRFLPSPIPCCFCRHLGRLFHKLLASFFASSLGLGCGRILGRAEGLDCRFRQITLTRLGRRFSGFCAPLLRCPILERLLRRLHSLANSFSNSSASISSSVMCPSTPQSQGPLSYTKHSSMCLITVTTTFRFILFS